MENILNNVSLSYEKYGVTIEPFSLDFGTVLVGDTSLLRFSILNSNEKKIFYDIFILEIAKSPKEKESENAFVEQYPQRKLYCEKFSSGFLHGRTHKDINLIFKPNSRKFFDFLVLCSVKDIEEGKERYDSTSETTSPNLYFGKYTFQDLRFLPQCRATGVGSYPLLGIIDIRDSKGVSKADLWERFSLNKLNEELSSDMDKEKLGEMRRKSQSVFFDQAIKGLKRFPFDFGSASIGSKTTMVYIEIKNLGKLPSSFQFKFSTDNIVEVERWAETRVVSNEEDMFAIQPKKALLKPGESITICLRYFHEEMKVHCTPILFTIDSGKSVVLELKGNTLAPNQRYLQLNSQVFKFFPVHIGSLHPPYQYVPMRNISDICIRYNVDTDGLKSLGEQNYGYPILLLHNPTGEIPPQGIQLLKFTFHPLEIVEYSVELPIYVEDGETFFLTLVGRGINKESENPSNVELSMKQGMYVKDVIKIGNILQYQGEKRLKPQDDGLVLKLPELVPSFQILPPTSTKQLVHLSMEVIRYGVISTHSINRQLVIMRNISKIDSISFEWKSSHLLPLEGEHEKKGHVTPSLLIQPEKGELKPNELRVIRIELNTGSLVQILDFDIACLIVNIDERKRLEMKRTKYEEYILQAEKKKEDIQTPKSKPALKKSTKANAYTNQEKKQSNKSILNSSVVTRHLRNNSSMDSKSATSTMTLGTKKHQELQTTGFILGGTHLEETEYRLMIRIEGYVVKEEQFKRAYGSFMWNSCFFPQIISHERPLKKGVDVLGNELKVLLDQSATYSSFDTSCHTHHEKKLFCEVLSSMIRECINDPDVRRKCSQIDDIQTPYYCQISNIASQENNNTIDDTNKDEAKDLKIVNGNITSSKIEGHSVFSGKDNTEETRKNVLQETTFKTLSEKLLSTLFFDILNEKIHNEAKKTPPL